MAMRDTPGAPGGPRIRLKRRHRRLATTITVVLTVVILAIYLVSSGGPKAVPSRAARADVTTTSASVPTAPTTTTTVTPTTTTTTTTTNPAGSLPQTGDLPTSDSPQFQSEMAALWAAVTQNSPTEAQSAFFPEAAYLQLKTLPSDSSDYQYRLLYDYSLDIVAANGLLGPDAATATLVSVNVPGQYAHWVPPGVCSNQIGYFEVANSRLVYDEDGVTHSIGIASLISWRGEWYVVHLGAIVRPSDSGVVLDPETGAGDSPPSSTC
jgi:hypothetical protein